MIKYRIPDAHIQTLQPLLCNYREYNILILNSNYRVIYSTLSISKLHPFFIKGINSFPHKKNFFLLEWLVSTQSFFSTQKYLFFTQKSFFPHKNRIFFRNHSFPHKVFLHTKISLFHTKKYFFHTNLTLFHTSLFCQPNAIFQYFCTLSMIIAKDA